MFLTDFFPSPEIFFFKSKRKMLKFARKNGLDIVPSDTEGRTYAVQKGEHCYILTYVSSKLDKAERDSILMHECVHVAQYWAEMLEDDNPSNEFIAYASQAAYLACKEQM